MDVSLNKGLATVKLKPGNTVRPEQFWQAVHNNGFTPKETRVVVRGEIRGRQFQVAGSNQMFDMIAEAKLLDEMKLQTGKTVTLGGAVTPGKDLKAPVPLRVQEIHAN